MHRSEKKSTQKSTAANGFRKAARKNLGNLNRFKMKSGTTDTTPSTQGCSEFMDFIKHKYSGKYAKIVVVLDALITAVTFYESVGFKWTTTEKKYNSIFNIDEKTENDHFIMVYEIK